MYYFLGTEEIVHEGQRHKILSPAKSQDLAYIAHLLVLTNICLKFFLSSSLGFPLHSGKGNLKPPMGDWLLWGSLSWPRPPRPFELNPRLTCTDGSWSDLWNDLQHLYLIIILKSSPREEPQPCLHNIQCMHRHISWRCIGDIVSASTYNDKASLSNI